MHYQFTAQDFSLVDAGLVTPCPAGTILTREYFNAPWYRALTGETDASTNHLYALSGACDVPYTGTLSSLTVYDAVGNHTTVVAAPSAPSISQEWITTPTLVLTKPPPPPVTNGGVLILEPNPGLLLNSTLPVNVKGGAFSPNSLKSLFIRVDRRVIFTTHWPRPGVKDTTWMAPWTPKGEGAHQIEATLKDWKGHEYTGLVTVIVDTQPPELAIATQVITSTHLINHQVTVAGTANDENGIAAVDLEVGGVWHPAVVSAEAWTATWIPELDSVPDGEMVSVVARAIDRAGWSTLTAAEIYVDAVAPAPVELSFNYQAVGATVPITQTGTTIRDPGAVVQMAWTASRDGSGLADYQAGWTTSDASGTSTTWTNVSPNQPHLAPITPSEAQKLVARLGTSDLYGNTTWQEFGPVYADSPLTPDYTLLDGSGGVYHGWMDSGCTLLGVDRRVSRIAPRLAMHHNEQALYATWDNQALRLAWSGANWSIEGDLFIYLDTLPGGSDTVFDPFTPANTPSGTISHEMTPHITLPGGGLTASQGEAMQADYGVWVQDAQTAWLIAWQGGKWVASTRLSETQFRYQPGADGGLTDLYLPFDLLGINDPVANSLGLLAFATEEEALKLWAVLPRANPVTSLLATGSFGHILEEITDLKTLSVPMTHFYQWQSLGAGLCPNGILAQEADQTPYPDAEVQAYLTADPSGIVYHYLGDHLYAWSDYLLGDKPLDFSQLLKFLDTDHPYVKDGQTLTYSLHVQNNGKAATHSVAARVWSTAALILPGGSPVPGDEHLYFQEIAIGDLLPGEERTVSFEGRVDLAHAQPRYEACLAAFPDRPGFCELALRMALLKVEIVDQTHTAPLERIWADHRVDFEAPRFIGITSPGLHIPANGVHLSGYAFDESGVSQLSLEVQRPDGKIVSLPCLEVDISGGSWSCDWDPTEIK